MLAFYLDGWWHVCPWVCVCPSYGHVLSVSWGRLSSVKCTSVDTNSSWWSTLLPCQYSARCYCPSLTMWWNHSSSQKAFIMINIHTCVCIYTYSIRADTHQIGEKKELQKQEFIKLWNILADLSRIWLNALPSQFALFWTSLWHHTSRTSYWCH